MGGLIYLRDQRRLWAGGGEKTTARLPGGAVWAKPASGPPHPLAAWRGTGPGGMATLFDMTWQGGHVLTGGDVSAVKNLGGSGAAHDMVAGASAPALASNAMFFAAGDAMNMASEANLNGVHLFALIKLTNPGINETQAIVGHSGTASTGTPGEIQYIRQNATARLRLQNMVSQQGIYAVGVPVGSWVVVGARYNWVSGDGPLSLRFNGGAVTSLALPQGGDLRINRLGGGLFKGEVRAVASVVQAPGYDAANREPAGNAVHAYFTSIAA